MNKRICLLLLSFFCLTFAATWFFCDLYSFISLSRGDYKTPWYSQNVLREPATNFMLMFYPSRKVHTHNVVGEPWLIRETSVGDVVFWTLLKRGADAAD